jgi:hypothetical protein
MPILVTDAETKQTRVSPGVLEFLPGGQMAPECARQRIKPRRSLHVRFQVNRFAPPNAVTRADIAYDLL